MSAGTRGLEGLRAVFSAFPTRFFGVRGREEPEGRFLSVVFLRLFALLAFLLRTWDRRLPRDVFFDERLAMRRSGRIAVPHPDSVLDGTYFRTGYGKRRLRGVCTYDYCPSHCESFKTVTPMIR